MMSNIISRCSQILVVHKTGSRPIHIDQEIDIMKVDIVPYISIEYLLFNFRSKPSHYCKIYNFG